MKRTQNSSIQKKTMKDFLTIFLARLKEWFEDDKQLDCPQFITPKVFLHNCSSVEEHYARLQSVLSSAKGRHSIDGLRAAGFDYKFVPCNVHREEHEREGTNSGSTCIHTLEAQLKKRLQESTKSTDEICTKCGTHLYFMETSTMITMENRKQYIADGPMYEVIVRMCQEYAQELMQHAGSLHWVSVCEDEGKGDPIRILVDCNFQIRGDRHVATHAGNKSANAPKQLETTSMINCKSRHGSTCTISESGNATGISKPTLLITTGKGKVRAGIFSRQHLLVSSIESSTALPMILDAKRRKMSVAILDVNARGDWNGMTTYEQSMEVLFGLPPSSSSDDNNNDHNIDDHTSPLYILAHSASGAQLTRYLQSDGHHLFPRIRSIAFTDSNHSIQWLNNDDHSHIASFFQSPSTVYIRSANEYRDEGWKKYQAGDIVKTDQYWHHRFGSVETLWAGTAEHSLSNWTSHEVIWSHFDKCGTAEVEGTDTKPRTELNTCIGEKYGAQLANDREN